MQRRLSYRRTGPRGFLAGLLLAALGAAAPGPARAADFPISSTGDIWFQADYAGFLGDDGQVQEEYYLRVLNNQLTFQDEEGTLTANLYVRLTFRDADDNELGQAGHRYRLQVADQSVAGSADHAQILLLREPLDPRAASVEVQLEDLNVRKRGLLYMFTGKRKNGTAEGPLIPPPFRGRDFGVSDIQFAWEVHDGTPDSPFRKNDLDVVPNPGRSYGLLQPRMQIYYEVYDRRDSTRAGGRYRIRYQIQSPDGRKLDAIPDSVESRSGEWVRVTSFDVSRLPTGEYGLQVTVTDPATGAEASSSRPFSVIWKSGSWDRTEEDKLDEARVLFTEDQFDQFKSMSSGDRELYLEQFWAKADPSPGTARNELRNEFMRRVQFANHHYGTGGKGMLTDRGRIYIRFGEPDEVDRELVPTKDNQLDQLVPELSDENSAARTLASNDEVDTRAYEVWTYTRQGTPLFPEREKTTSVTGLKFVFVDESGTGRYVLRYSSDFIGY